MRHLILGAGNLGTDLSIALKAIGHHVDIASASLNGYVMPRDVGALPFNFKPDVVWNCIGCGSVEQGENDFGRQFLLCADLVISLTKTFPDCTVITFGSDYSINDHESMYAINKHIQSEVVTLLQSRDVQVKEICVAGLYGTHKPRSTLPYKLAKNILSNHHISLPANGMTLTPTDWLAQKIVEKLESILASKSITYIAPGGIASVHGIGEAISKRMARLGIDKRSIITLADYDPKRPKNSEISYHCTYWDVGMMDLLINRAEFYIDLAMRDFQEQR